MWAGNYRPDLLAPCPGAFPDPDSADPSGSGPLVFLASTMRTGCASITAVAIAGFAVGRSWPAAPADDRAYYVKAIEGSLAACLENLEAKEGER
jgi:hypothetical protein